jgi:Flp pilus assembly protein TadG
MFNLPQKLWELVRRFRADQRGNMVTMFALASLPLVGAVGAAVDYSRANSIKTAMQAAADSTALMLAKTISSGSLNDNQVSQKANDYFAALFNRPDALGVQVNATYVQQAATGSQVTVAATASAKSNFMAIVGVPMMKIGVSALSTWGGGSKMQVALALDNTGSMFDYNKIGSLKSATHSLLDQLKAAAANPNDVNVAIIPFSRDVNVGATQSNINAPWIDWSDWDSENGSDVTTQSCTKVVSKKGKPAKQCVNSTTWKPDSHSTWNGCITDRDQSYDVTNTSPNPADKSLPASSPSTLFPADQYDGCPVPMLGLTNNWTALNSKVDEMTPNGFTNQAIGLAWAWLALSTGQPMNAPGKGPDVQQIIILLTDGMNTEDRWYNDQASIDARQRTLCSNIKAAGITLYTIQVNTGNADPVSTLLQQCASKPEYFFLITTANGIVTAFNKIGTNLSQLRLAK